MQVLGTLPKIEIIGQSVVTVDYPVQKDERGK